MLFNTYTDGDPRSFMYYKEDYYINGTKITLKDDYIESRKFNGDKLWKYARFDHQTTCKNQTAYFFCRDKYQIYELYDMGYSKEEISACRQDYAPYFVLTASELEGAIEEITYPIKLSKEETTVINNAIIDMIDKPKRDWDDPSLLILWIIYIAVMVGSLIFNQFYIIWAIASIAFYYTRKGML